MTTDVHLRALIGASLLLVACDEPGSSEPGGFDGVHPDECMSGTEGTQHDHCEGLEFDLHVSAECLERACGLIVDVHGATMTGADQEAHTSLGMLARGRGYIVLQPWAPEMFWNDSFESPLDAAVVALARRAMNVFSIDARRVHLTGFSQGAYMTWRMLCRQPDMFASYAPIAGTGEHILGDERAGCVDTGNGPVAPRPVLYAHGTRDAIVPFSGASETIETLRSVWELAEEQSLDAGEDYDVVRYSGAGRGSIEFIEHHLSTDYSEEVFGSWEGHCFPGTVGPISCGAGPAWGERVMSFFEAHPEQ